MIQSSRLRTDWLLLAGFCGFLFFFGLSSFGLLGADEPRYAQVAREMLVRHDWVTPTLGGSPWLEKPPLYYWQAMLAYSFFGVSDWAARLPSAVDATLMVIAVYFFLRRFRPGSQVDGALMVAATAGVIGFARAASMEMALTTALTVALCSWYGWYESESKRYLALFYISLAVGTLAKGPVAVLLPVLIIGIFATSRDDYQVLRRTIWFPGIIFFSVVALPWYVAVQVRNPEFLRVFILQHNLERFSTNLYHHRQPFWFYVPVALAGIAPWTVITVASLARCIRAWWAGRPGKARSKDALEVFLTVWFLVPIVFFSISQSKLPGYILPAFPGAALLVAIAVQKWARDGGGPGMLLTVTHAVVAAGPLVPALMVQYLVQQHRLPWNRAALISFAFAGIVAVGIAMTLRRRAGPGMLRFVTLVPVVLIVGALLRVGAPALESKLSARPLAAEIGRLEMKPLPVAVFRTSRETEYGLAFYRNQVILRYDRDPAPAGEHLVVAPGGFQADLRQRVPGRRVSYLGSFQNQDLDYFWVAADRSQ